MLGIYESNGFAGLTLPRRPALRPCGKCFVPSQLCSLPFRYFDCKKRQVTPVDVIPVVGWMLMEALEYSDQELP